MKQYAIAGFLTGILMGLLIGLAEMRLFKQLQHSYLLPFVVDTTVVASANTGVADGIKMAKRVR